jgi:proline dehydrogenase
MFRSFFIYLSKAIWARRIVTGWSFAWKMASRFVSGDKLDHAIAAIKKLNSNGINATLDHLGEHTSTAEASRQATGDILQALDAIQVSGARANMSIKLTQIGLKIDRDLCADNLREILTHAKALGNFIRVDMEDSPVTQVTLDLLLQMHREGFDNVGLVIQSYLFRSEEDTCNLIRNGIPVRLCKGAYKEPAEVAFPKKSDVDSNYDRLAELLMKGALEQGSKPLSADGRFPPLTGLATHDDKRIANAKAFAHSINLPKSALEFQMLYGIRRDLQEQAAKEGYPVRVYVPYGTEWYPYYMRRLAERPANVWFFISNFFRN